jgi:8-oxo-dGTP diphosphatase
MTRACGAVILNDRILMVRHAHNGREYWTLPGGKIEDGEPPSEAAVREVWEETGLDLKIERYLFSTTSAMGSVTRCYLMVPPDPGSTVALGEDPEEAHLAPEERMLQDVRWHSLESMREDAQVSEVIRALAKGAGT